MRRSIFISLAALMTATSSPAQTGDGPGYSGEYEIYYDLLNGYGQKIGYDVTYCDGTREIHVQPGNSVYQYGPPFPGNCWSPLPLPH